MPRIGTPLSASAVRVLLCGSGELGKELVIELQRLGVEVIAVDRYANAPAMQVAHRHHVIDMLDGAALRGIIELEKPHYIVPEIEAIATATLVELEAEGLTVIPTARAAQLTMNREGIRRLAAEELGLPTSPYRFADSLDDCRNAALAIGFPCLIKPVMSSSGKGQSVLRSEADIDAAWEYAQVGGRAGKGRVIVEGFIDFDYEITLLTVRHVGGTTFCQPVGHRQERGDYQESWQPQPMSAAAMAEAERIALAVTGALGGRGLFGVELFVKGDQVWFCEISPRPHDTGLVTLISQDLSEFALHARAILGLPIPAIRQFGPSASAVLLVSGESQAVSFGNLGAALAEPDTALRLFGKPEVQGQRRMGVALARGESIEAA
nr:formate-dependent phosphoribosylglycinamide formyltransferase [Pseudomonas sp.]